MEKEESIFYLKPNHFDTRMTYAPNCENSRNLFKLWKRSHIETSELYDLYQLINFFGFTIKLQGDMREVVPFLNEKGIPHVNYNMTEVNIS